MINKNNFASFRIILDYPHLQVKQISDKLKREAINGKNHWYALVLLALLAIGPIYEMSIKHGVPPF